MQTGQTGIFILLFIFSSIPSCSCCLSEGIKGNLTLKNLQVSKVVSHSPLFSIPKTTFQSRLSLETSSFSHVSQSLFLLNKNHLLAKRTQFKSLGKELILSSTEQECINGKSYTDPVSIIEEACFIECYFTGFLNFNNQQIMFSKCSFQSSNILSNNQIYTTASYSSFDQTTFQYMLDLQKLCESNFTLCEGCLTVESQNIVDETPSIYCCYWDHQKDMILSVVSKISINGMFIKDYQSTMAVISLIIPKEDLLVRNSIFNMNKEDYIFNGEVKSITFENCCFTDKEKLYYGKVHPTFINIKENSCEENVFINTIDYKINYKKSVIFYNREHEVDWSYDPH